MFDDVIVQKPPAWKLYSEHSFVTWSAPLRAAGVAEPAAATIPPAAIANTSAKARFTDLLGVIIFFLIALPLLSSAGSDEEARPGAAPRSSVSSLHFELRHPRCELSAVANTRLSQHVRDVALDRLPRDKELTRDLRIT